MLSVKLVGRAGERTKLAHIKTLPASRINLFARLVRAPVAGGQSFPPPKIELSGKVSIQNCKNVYRYFDGFSSSKMCMS